MKKIYFSFVAALIFSANVFAATITSTATGNWNAGATWVGGVAPAAGDNAVIANTHVVTLTAAASITNVTINAGGTLNGGSSILSVAGIWSNTGTFTYSTGTISFNGAGAQTIPAEIFYHLTLDCVSSSKTLGGNIEIKGDFTVVNSISIMCVSWRMADQDTIEHDNEKDGDPIVPMIAGTFVPAGFTVTFNGTGTQTITSRGLTFYNLTSNTTGPLIFTSAGNNPIHITNTLTMTAGLYDISNPCYFVLGSMGGGGASFLSRTASTTTNYMYGGTFIRGWPATAITSTSGNYYGLFPMGTSVTSTYRPLEINTTVAPTSAGFFTVNHVDANGNCDLSPFYNDAGTNIERINNAQFITDCQMADGTYNIAVTMTGLGTAGNAANDIRLVIYTGGPSPIYCTASAAGVHAPATGTPQNPTAKRTGLTAANMTANVDFRISSINAGITPLPVEMLLLNANCDGNSVKITWTTTSEYNNDYFAVEKGIAEGTNVTWEEIGKVKGGGSSSSIRNYEFVDSEPPTATYYYRLKQTDFNGQYEYFQLVSANCFKEIDVINIFPNPASTIIDYTITSPKDLDASVIVTDVLGRNILKKQNSIKQGQNRFSLDISFLSSGNYVLQVSAGNGSYKLHKQFAVK